MHAAVRDVASRLNLDLVARRAPLLISMGAIRQRACRARKLHPAITSLPRAIAEGSLINHALAAHRSPSGRTRRRRARRRARPSRGHWSLRLRSALCVSGLLSLLPLSPFMATRVLPREPRVIASTASMPNLNLSYAEAIHVLFCVQCPIAYLRNCCPQRYQSLGLRMRKGVATSRSKVPTTLLLIP